MNIQDAMHAASDEYSEECRRASEDRAFSALLRQTLHTEYKALDEVLPDLVAEIFQSQGWEDGILDPRIYQACKMCFRMGMRTQRKIDHPELPTSTFWRSDQRKD